MVYHMNTEREQKKEQERIEKERMRRLMVCSSVTDCIVNRCSTKHVSIVMVTSG